MGVLDQEITDRYAVYLGDCMEVMAPLADGSVHLSVYSPPFAGLYVSQGRYSDAEPLYRRALVVFAKALGKTHRHVVTTLLNYATLLRDLHPIVHRASCATQDSFIRPPCKRRFGPHPRTP